MPTLVTDWGDWLKSYPRGVAYKMFEKYQPVELTARPSEDSLSSRRGMDKRLHDDTAVLGVVGGKTSRAYPLAEIAKTGLVHDEIDGQACVILWYGHTKTAAAYRPIATSPKKEGGKSRPVTLEIDGKTRAPFTDTETGSRWDSAGRAVAGELKGWTLQWVDGTQVKWFAWAAEYPESSVYGLK